jgi:hypothetical protein
LKVVVAAAAAAAWSRVGKKDGGGETATILIGSFKNHKYFNGKRIRN